MQVGTCSAAPGLTAPGGPRYACSPLHTAIGYYDNQREALHRFVDDGRLRVDDNISEGALDNHVPQGRRGVTDQSTSMGPPEVSFAGSATSAASELSPWSTSAMTRSVTSSR